MIQRLYSINSFHSQFVLRIVKIAYFDMIQPCRCCYLYSAFIDMCIAWPFVFYVAEVCHRVLRIVINREGWSCLQLFWNANDRIQFSKDEIKNLLMRRDEGNVHKDFWYHSEPGTEILALNFFLRIIQAHIV